MFGPGGGRCRGCARPATDHGDGHGAKHPHVLGTIGYWFTGDPPASFYLHVLIARAYQYEYAYSCEFSHVTSPVGARWEGKTLRVEKGKKKKQ